VSTATSDIVPTVPSNVVPTVTPDIVPTATADIAPAQQIAATLIERNGPSGFDSLLRKVRSLCDNGAGGGDRGCAAESFSNQDMVYP
jgi:hypothetical protein